MQRISQQWLFDLKRILRTRYRIDDFQETYFVIDSFEQLMGETAPDFAPIYRELDGLAEFEPGEIQPTDGHAQLVEPGEIFVTGTADQQARLAIEQSPPSSVILRRIGVPVLGDHAVAAIGFRSMFWRGLHYP